MRGIIVADNQFITSIGIRSILVNQIGDIGEIFVSADKDSLLELLSAHPDSVVILDYTLFDLASIDELEIVSERYADSSWLLFSDELSDTFLRQLLAKNLLLSIVFKSASYDEIVSAMQATLDYQRYLSKSLQKHFRLLTKSADSVTDNSLTVTEKGILKEIASGKTTKEIAADRNLSFHTIITHRKNIFRKLEVNTVHEATKYAIRAGIVDVSDYYI
ncbi:MAG: hypothetical protein RL662_365 [Bacteroidota bacterium]|jgi:DNA-binding NarL/FixJ family response regulator